MRRELYGLLGIGLAFGLWYLLDPPREEEAPPPLPPVYVQAEEPMEELDPEPPAPPPRRELSIAGRVVDGSLRPMPGLTLRLGAEETTTDARGVFEFAASLRPRESDLVLFSSGTSAGGEEPLAVWRNTLTGDANARDEDGPLASLDIPERPERLRWTCTLPGDGTEQGTEQGTDDSSDDGTIAIESALAEEWGQGARIRLQGTAKLPERAGLAANLSFDRLRALAGVELAELKEARFEAVIYAPAHVAVYSGEYRAEVVFNPLIQRREFEEQYPPYGQGALQGAQAHKRIEIGDTAEACSQDLAAQEYYGHALDEIEILERSLKARVAEARRLAKDWDSRWRLAASVAREGWFHEPVVGPDGRIRIEEWRRFLDELWRPRVRGLLVEHEERGQEKYRHASDHLLRLLRALLKLSYIDSKFVVYPAFGIRPDEEKDWFEDAYGLGDRVLELRTLRGSTAELQRYRRLVEPAPGGRESRF